jgi:phosphoribosylaminoimidazole-succinocarboxamide synthase
MEKQTMLYEGKAKQIYSCENSNYVVIHYKDDATAGNGDKKAQFANKGPLNAAISTIIFEYLIENGIPTHFVEQLNERDVVCEKVSIIPLEVIIRNLATGSLTRNLGITEGTKLIPPVVEICYKNDDYGDPLINTSHAIALGLATKAQLNVLYAQIRKINELLITRFEKAGITLVDFKIEFGTNAKGEVVLADEISPDTCRFWDAKTGNKLDKDRFRQDLGDVMGAYEEIHKRLLTTK